MTFEEFIMETDMAFITTYKGVQVSKSFGEHFAWEVAFVMPTGKLYGLPFHMGLGHHKHFYSDEWHKACRTARKSNSRMEIRAKWAKGSYAVPTPPTAAEVLQCLQSDCSSGQHLLFEDFCSDFGYDTGCGRAEETWRACQTACGNMQHLLGSKFEAFMDLEEDC